MKVGKINSSQDGIVFDVNGEVQTLSAGNGNVPKILIDGKNNQGGGKTQIVAMRGRNNADGKIEQKLEVNNNDESNTLTGVQKDNLVLQVKSATKNGYEEAGEGDSINLSMPKSKTRRGRVGVGVAQTLDTQANQSVLLSGKIRRLTEVECERLQGFKDGHTEFGAYPIKKVTQKQMNKMSNDELIKLFETTVTYKTPKGQRYKLCGNAVTKNIVELIGRKLLQNVD